jgi:hypothetical protein
MGALSLAYGQTRGTLAELQQIAEKKGSEWEALAKALDAKVARLLPCDARVVSSIDDVSRASDARLAAIGDYRRAAAANVKEGAAAVKSLQASRDAAARELATEQTETDQERTAIEAQSKVLAESLTRRATLAEARKTLESLTASARQRSTLAQEQIAQLATLDSLLNDLNAGFLQRQAAIDEELNALTVETRRWTAYYSARLARARTECAVINPGGAEPSPRKATKKKQ